MNKSVKIIWLSALVLILSILVPGPALAQDAKTDLILRLVSADYHPIKTGENNIFFMELQNNGVNTLNNIRMSSNQPDGWVVEIKPANITSLSAGSIQTVDVNINPVKNEARGDYQVTVIAESNEIRRVQSIWVRVETPSFWLWVGIALGVIVIAGFIIVFMRLNKS